MKILLVGAPAPKIDNPHPIEGKFWDSYYSILDYLVYKHLTKEEKSGIRLIESQRVGLLSIGAVLEEKGYKVEYLASAGETQSEFVDIFLQRIEIGGYQIIGFTCPSILYPYVKKLSNLAKNMNRDTIVIVGGPHPSYLDKNILAESPSIDICVRGEGEITMFELVSAISEGRPLCGIPGISYRSEKSSFSINPDRQKSKVRNFPMPAHHLIPHQLPTARVYTAVGCPHKCVFCADTIWLRHWAKRPLETFIKEVTYLYHEKGTIFMFLGDEDLATSTNHLQLICRTLIDLDLPDLYWGCQCRIRSLARGGTELIQMMKNAGCVEIQIGIESGHNDVLNFNNKGLTIEEVYPVAEIIQSVGGICVTAYWIIGLPGETKETAEATIQQAEKLIDEDLTNAAELICWVPTPGCQALEAPQKFGVEIADEIDWARLRGEYIPMYSLTHLSSEEIYHYYLNGIERLYLALEREIDRYKIPRHEEFYGLGTNTMGLF